MGLPKAILIGSAAGITGAALISGGPGAAVMAGVSCAVFGGGTYVVMSIMDKLDKIKEKMMDIEKRQSAIEKNQEGLVKDLEDIQKGDPAKGLEGYENDVLKQKVEQIGKDVKDLKTAVGKLNEQQQTYETPTQTKTNDDRNLD